MVVEFFRKDMILVCIEFLVWSNEISFFCEDMVLLLLVLFVLVVFCFLFKRVLFDIVFNVVLMMVSEEGKVRGNIVDGVCFDFCFVLCFLKGNLFCFFFIEIDDWRFFLKVFFVFFMFLLSNDMIVEFNILFLRVLLIFILLLFVSIEELFEFVLEELLKLRRLKRVWKFVFGFFVWFCFLFGGKNKDKLILGLIFGW